MMRSSITPWAGTFSSSNSACSTILIRVGDMRHTAGADVVFHIPGEDRRETDLPPDVIGGAVFPVYLEFFDVINTRWPAAS